MLHGRPSLAALFGLGAALMWGGCGWKVGGSPVVALSVGEVHGAPDEPGLRAEVIDAVRRALRERGVEEGGPVVVLEVMRSSDTPDAVSSTGQVTAAWRSRLEVRGAVEGRPGCEASATAERAWSLPAGEPRDASAARAQAHETLARYVAERLVDGLLARPECR